jgi:Methyltransferase domain
MLRQLANSNEPTSFANKLRAKRFRQFEALAAGLPRPLRLLDVGGTNAFWENRGWHRRTDVEVFTLNLVAEERRHANIISLAGDARNLTQFGDRSLDVVFSNSVIEHLFTFEDQRRMASEIQRVGKAFWVQTPNYWFPIEPHFHFIGWQWLPLAVRVSILRRWTCGWRGPCPDPIGARRLVEEIRLLTRKELRELFPRADIVAERFYGFVKSWIAVGGFN